jgi:hypothetical protein
VGRKQNKGKEDGPQEWLEKGEKDLIEEIEAEKVRARTMMSEISSLFIASSPKKVRATKEKIISDEPRA